MDYKEVRIEKLKDLKLRLSKLDKKLGLVVIKVGKDISNEVNIKEGLFSDLGINYILREFSIDASEDEIISAIKEYNLCDKINGIFVTLPLPKHINSFNVINSICPNKDIEGLTQVNLSKVFEGKECLCRRSVCAIGTLLKSQFVSLRGKNVCIISKSNKNTRDLFMMLTNNDATVTMCDSNTLNLKSITKSSDVVIVDSPYILTSDMLKDDVVLIDLCNNISISNINKYKYISTSEVNALADYELCENVYRSLKLKKM